MEAIRTSRKEIEINLSYHGSFKVNKEIEIRGILKYHRGLYRITLLRKWFEVSTTKSGLFKLNVIKLCHRVYQYPVL